jgi:hypothetical protein
MINCSRRQLRRAIWAQLRNCSSLDKQIRTPISRLLSLSMAIPSVERFGFALMKAVCRLVLSFKIRQRGRMVTTKKAPRLDDGGAQLP